MAQKKIMNKQKKLDVLLYLAVKEDNVQQAGHLIEQGANAKWSYICQLKKGDTHLNESLLSIALENKNIEMVRLLIKNGADVKFQTISGIIQSDEDKLIIQYETLLRQAAKIKDPSFAEMLIQNGAEVNDERSEGIHSTPLFDAVEQGCYKTAELLLKKGAHPGAHALPTSKFMEGEINLRQIPLGEAVCQGNYDMTRLLLEYGAMNYISDEVRTTLIKIAAKGTDKYLESLLLATPQDLNEAFQLIQFRNPDWAKRLINKGAELEYPVDIGRCQEEYFLGIKQIPIETPQTTPLARAITAKKYDIARLMLKKGTNLRLSNLTDLIKTKNFAVFNEVIRGNHTLLKKYGELFLKIAQAQIHPPYERYPNKEASLFYKSLLHKIQALNKQQIQKKAKSLSPKKRIKTRE